MAVRKRGLCWPVDNKDAVFTFTKPGSKISWIYNWSPNVTPDSGSLEFVPMAWNHVGLDQLPSRCQQSGATAVLGFNEPELADQSNMSAEMAAAEWLRHVEPLRKTGLRVGSPGISSAPHAISWLQDFLKRIRAGGSDVDFFCLHWYGEQIGQLYDYLWSIYYQLGGPDSKKRVWLTEYACTNWNEGAPLPESHVLTFARETIKYLDELEWIDRYAWFGPMRNTGTVGRYARMLDDDGRLTEVGKLFRDA